MWGRWETSPEDRWAKVLEAVGKKDARALTKALAYYRKAVPRTEVDLRDIATLPSSHGNTAAAALGLLKGNMNLRFRGYPQEGRDDPVLMALADAMIADWQKHGVIRKELSTLSQDRFPLEDAMSLIIQTGSAQWLKAAISLFETHSHLITNSPSHAKWIQCALNIKPEENRLACIEALAQMDITPTDVKTALEKEHNGGGGMLIGSPPRLDAKTLGALLDVCGHKEEDQHAYSNMKSLILNVWPSKSFIDVLERDGSITGMALELVRHAQGVHKDTSPIHTDYGAAWEDRRRGMLYLYSKDGFTFRNDSSRAYADQDKAITKVIAKGFKARLDEQQRRPDVMVPWLKEELEFYTKAGVLPELFEIAGPATGFATNAEYLAALREQIVPSHFTVEDKRSELMRRGDWANYMREKEMTHKDSALVAYSRAGGI